MVINGCDVSSVQGIINWNDVVKQGQFKFIFCKNYNGNDGQDPYYNSNITNSTNAGLFNATYNFLYPLIASSNHPNRDPVGQAQLHFSTTKTNVVSIDLEWPAPQDWATWGCSANQICDWTLKYLETYTSLSGRKPLIYSYPYFIEALNPPSDFNNYDLWIASYASTPLIPKPWTTWKVWQNSGGTIAHLPNGEPVDTNVVNDLSLWGVNSTVVELTQTPSPAAVNATQIDLPENLTSNSTTPNSFQQASNLLTGLFDKFLKK